MGGRVIAEFVRVEGHLIPRHLYEQMLHEQRMGYKVDPARLARAMNRRTRRVLERRARKVEKQMAKAGAPIVAAPTIVPKPVSEAEAIERVVQMLEEGMAEHTHPGTIVTLEGVLDRAEAAIVEKAWKQGRPIPREQIRNAITEIKRRGDAQRTK